MPLQDAFSLALVFKNWNVQFSFLPGILCEFHYSLYMWTFCIIPVWIWETYGQASLPPTVKWTERKSEIVLRWKKAVLILLLIWDSNDQGKYKVTQRLLHELRWMSVIVSEFFFRLVRLQSAWPQICYSWTLKVCTHPAAGGRCNFTTPRAIYFILKESSASLMHVCRAEKRGSLCSGKSSVKQNRMQITEAIMLGKNFDSP